MRPGKIDLDVTSFTQYGPHRITISAQLAASNSPLYVNLQSEEDLRAGGTNIATFQLTTAQPSASWGYVAMSPFRAGYVFRQAAMAGQPSGSWSPVQSPVSSLSLDAVGNIVPVQGAAGAAMAAGSQLKPVHL
jgi:hypothetical protein